MKGPDVVDVLVRRTSPGEAWFESDGFEWRMHPLTGGSVRLAVSVTSCSYREASDLASNTYQRLAREGRLGYERVGASVWVWPPEALLAALPSSDASKVPGWVARARSVGVWLLAEARAGRAVAYGPRDPQAMVQIDLSSRATSSAKPPLAPAPRAPAPPLPAPPVAELEEVEGVAVTITVEGEQATAQIGDVLLHLTRLEGRDRMRDVDLAELLGFDRPRKIRELIRRMASEGKLRAVVWRPTVGRQRTGFGERAYEVDEAWLTREECLLVAAQSKAPKAWAITELMARVFDRLLSILAGRAQGTTTQPVSTLPRTAIPVEHVRPADDEDPERIVDLATMNLAAEQGARLSTGLEGLDRLLGGGLVGGRTLLLTGAPGTGKSTLLAKVVGHLAAAGRVVLYVTGEELLVQVAARMERLEVRVPGVFGMETSSIDEVLARLAELTGTAQDPALVVIDSVQAVRTLDAKARAGRTQVGAVTALLRAMAHGSGRAVVLVGQVLKDGDFAGPRSLEHDVDAHLSLVRRPSGVRELVTRKNRYAPDTGTLTLTMGDKGLVEAVRGEKASMTRTRSRGA